MTCKNKQKPVRVIGIDPGTRICGYGIVDWLPSGLTVIDYGVVKGHSRKKLYERLHSIHRGLTEIFCRYQPEVAAVEGIFYGINARTAIKIGEGRGIALLAGAAAGIEVVEYSPRTAKKSVTGTGAAHKSQVQQMVKIQLALPDIPEPPDAADALSMAICHCHRLRNLRDEKLSER